MQEEHNRVAAIATVFRERFGSEADAIVRAPGRVEVLGGHTDYNDGFVMPAAIDRDVLIAVKPVPGDSVTMWSCNFEQESRLTLSPDIARDDAAPWSNYVRGVIDQLRKSGVLVPGMEMAIEGNIPLGSGLSSSAAIEVATAFAVMACTGGCMPGPDIALLCQRAENQFVGVNSGIMDQFISVLAQQGNAMFLDCRSLDYSFVKFPENTSIIVSDTRKPRTLAASEYNVRRAECEEAVELLRAHLPGIKALRDVSSDELERYAASLPEVVRKRARHIVNENERVLEAVEALKRGDGEEFGRIVNRSHESSRDLYEITIPELNWLQKAAVSVEGCLGSRLSGAGFGGCTVSIVQDDAIEQFIETVKREYEKKAGIEPIVDVLTASAGASRLR